MTYSPSNRIQTGNSIAVAPRDGLGFRHCLDYARQAAAGEVEGILGPASLSWQVYRETVLLAGGGRALLMQLANPAVAEGVYQHSRFGTDPLGRALRTASTMNSMVFGDLRTALRVAGWTYAVHSRVHGLISRKTSRRWAGSQYEANDPELKLWVHATLFDTALLVFERVIRPLSATQKERLYQEGKLLAALNGIPPACMPATYLGFRAYMRDTIAGSTLEVRETAREICASLFRAPWEALRVDTILTAGFLPASLRQAFDLRGSSRRHRLFESMLGILRETFSRLPPALRYAPSYHLALARLAAPEGRKPPRPVRLAQRLCNAAGIPLPL